MFFLTPRRMLLFFASLTLMDIPTERKKKTDLEATNKTREHRKIHAKDQYLKPLPLESFDLEAFKPF